MLIRHSLPVAALNFARPKLQPIFVDPESAVGMDGLVLLARGRRVNEGQSAFRSRLQASIKRR